MRAVALLNRLLASFVACLLLSAAALAGRCGDAELQEILAALSAPQDVPVAAERTFGFPPGVKPTRAEILAMEHTGMQAGQKKLSIEQVMAITRNFHDDIVLDGSTGLFLVEGEVHVDTSLNLFRGYRRIGSAFESRQAAGRLFVTVDDIKDLRKISTEALSVARRDGTRDLITQPFRMRDLSKPTHLAPEVHLDVTVEERMKAFGFEVRRGAGGTDITITQANFDKALKQYTDNINAMIAQGVAPEMIVSYAVQDLLILHPFAGGNGRTARLLGQALYERLTGKTIIFPASFKRELEFSLTDLAKDLGWHPPAGSGLANGSEWAARPTRDVLNYAAVESGASFGTVGRQPPPRLMADQEFHASVRLSTPDGQPLEIRVPDSKGTYANVTAPHGGRVVDVPVSATRYSHDVYFGKPAGDTLDDVEKTVGDLFTYGRSTPPGNNLTRDLDGHFVGKVHGGKNRMMNAGFFQTSKNGYTARGFALRSGEGARKGRYGVVFVIDPRGANCLDVEAAFTAAGRSYNHEGEVVFSAIPPTRFRAAIVYDMEQGDKIVKVYNNPVYAPRPDPVLPTAPPPPPMVAPPPLVLPQAPEPPPNLPGFQGDFKVGPNGELFLE